MIDYQGLTVLRYTSHQKVCQALIYINTDNNVIIMKNRKENTTLDHLVKGRREDLLLRLCGAGLLSRRQHYATDRSPDC